MVALAEGFMALPGGFGTLEELCEILTWSQLGLVSFPVGILNVRGYFDGLLSLFDHMVDQQFLKYQLGIWYCRMVQLMDYSIK